MTTRILLVRAVNVGGAKLPMAEFRELLTGLGGENVRTYIASGNAVLDVPGDADAFDRAVEQALTDRYGYVREVISRSPEELEAALQAHPFEVIEPKYLLCRAADRNRPQRMPSPTGAGGGEWRRSVGGHRRGSAHSVRQWSGPGGAGYEQGAEATGGAGDGAESEYGAGVDRDGVEGLARMLVEFDQEFSRGADLDPLVLVDPPKLSIAGDEVVGVAGDCGGEHEIVLPMAGYT